MFQIFSNVNVRFVVLLRDPVERAISGFGQNYPDSNLPEFFSQNVSQLIKLHQHCGHTLELSLHDCIGSNTSLLQQSIRVKRCFGSAHQSLLYRGLYVHQLRAFLCAGFKPEQFLILFTHQLANVSAILTTVHDFIAAPTSPILPISPPAQNSKSMLQEITPETRSDLIAFYRLSVLDLASFLIAHPFHYDLHAFQKEFQIYLSPQKNN